MPKVSVIIPNCNGEALLPDCLGSLRRQNFTDFEVLLVDNGSTDRSVSVAQQLMPGVRVLELGQNTGFAAACNRGMATAAGEYLVLLNNDTEAAPDFLGELATTLANRPQVGMVAPKILNYADRRQIDSVGGLLLTVDGIGQGRGRGELDRGQYDDLDEVLLPSGCAALYRRDMIREIGGFDPAFFAYCEDADLGLRGRRQGWQAVAAPRAVVYHKYSASTGGRHTPFKLFQVERNHYWVVIRNYPWPYLLLLPAATLYRHGCMLRILLARRGKADGTESGRLTEYLGAFIRAHGAALAELPRQWRERRRPGGLKPAEVSTLLRAHRVPIGKMVYTT